MSPASTLEDSKYEMGENRSRDSSLSGYMLPTSAGNIIHAYYIVLLDTMVRAEGSAPEINAEW